MLENVVGSQTYDLNQEAWKDLLYPKSDTDNTGISTSPSIMSNSSNPAIAEMTRELLEYRKNSSQKLADIEKF
jgi:hypothetical protein